MHGTKRKLIFTNRKLVTKYVRRKKRKHEKTEFYKNVKFGSVNLAFHYSSCFNASLLHYKLHIYFVSKK